MTRPADHRHQDTYADEAGRALHFTLPGTRHALVQVSSTLLRLRLLVISKPASSSSNPRLAATGSGRAQHQRRELQKAASFTYIRRVRVGAGGSRMINRWAEEESVTFALVSRQGTAAGTRGGAGQGAPGTWVLNVSESRDTAWWRLIRRADQVGREVITSIRIICSSSVRLNGRETPNAKNRLHGRWLC